MAVNVLATYNTGSTLYYVIVDSTGRVWNGTLFETVDLTHWQSYAISLPEALPPGTFEASFPTAIHVADNYSLIAYLQTGVAPSTTDAAVRAGIIGWDGTQEVPTGPGTGGGGGGGDTHEESFDVGALPVEVISILPGVQPVSTNFEIFVGVKPL